MTTVRSVDGKGDMVNANMLTVVERRSAFPSTLHHCVRHQDMQNARTI